MPSHNCSRKQTEGSAVDLPVFASGYFCPPALQLEQRILAHPKHVGPVTDTEIQNPPMGFPFHAMKQFDLDSAASGREGIRAMCDMRQRGETLRVTPRIL